MDPSQSSLPNPYTPLAFIPPSMASDFEASCYLYVATLGAFIWDWLMALPDEYKIICKKPIHLSKIVYCISRLGAMTYIVTSTIFQVAPVGSCQMLQYALGSFYTVSVPATSALFYLRVSAVFHHSKPVVIFFGILWVAILGTSFTVPLSIHGTHIGTTQRCINTNVWAYSSSAVITNTINDTLVFLAISFRLASFSMIGDSTMGRLRSFLKGDGLPKLSRMLLQSGQLYYFATVALNIVTMAMIIAPQVSPVFHAMFTIPNIALENAMATRVFRAIHLGIIQNEMLSLNVTAQPTGPTDLVFAACGSREGTGGRADMDDIYPLDALMFDRRMARCDNIEIMKTIETCHDGDGVPGKRNLLTDSESAFGQV